MLNCDAVVETIRHELSWLCSNGAELRYVKLEVFDDWLWCSVRTDRVNLLFPVSTHRADDARH